MLPSVFSEVRPGLRVCDKVFESFGQGIGIALRYKEAAGDIISRNVAQEIFSPFP